MTRPAPSLATPVVTLRPLDAIPCAAPGVEARTDSQGRIHLGLTIPARGRIEKFLRRIPGFDRPRYISLDEHGSAFWKLMDGRRTLAAITQLLAARCGIEHQAAAEAVVIFTKMLMIRNFLVLEISPLDEASVCQDGIRKDRHD